jgi:ribosomal protein L11 methylase PrmA
MMNLMQGDCLELMKTIPDGSVDMVLTDPPYGTTACKWDSVIPFEPMWEQLKRVTKKNGAIVMTASQPFTSVLVMSNPRAFHQSLVWRKNKASGHLNAKKRHLTGHEDVIVFCDGVPVYNPQMWKSRPSNSATRTKHTSVYGAQVSTTYEGGKTDRYPVSVLDFPVVNNDGTGDGRFHPTQKPVALMEYLIKTYTNENETVLDFTMGSGTTGVAAKNLNRNFIGIELDETYFNIAQERIANA